LWEGTDEFGQRITFMIPLAQENAVGSQTGLRESRALDVLFGYCPRATNWSLDIEGFDEGCPPSKPRIRRHSFFLED
jgi:hypothetical protein